MKPVQSILQKYGVTLTVLLFVVAASGCDALNTDKPEFSALTEQDLEAASAILGESLSDENEGLMADVNDMTADVDVRQLIYSNRRFWKDPSLRPCRGINREFRASYDETTGEHTIHYSRLHENDNCSKSIEVDLSYIFTDSTGEFIDLPRFRRREIATIAFEGSRVGSSSYVSEDGASRSRTSEQRGEWNLSGLQTNLASLTGSQTNTGSFEYTRIDTAGVQQTDSGSFDIEFNTVDVTIAQNRSSDSDVESLVTGTIQYTMTMEITRDGQTELKEAEGTIELEGNGQALLRFLGLRKVYRISLRNGAIRDADHDREGKNKDNDDEEDSD